MNLEQRVQVLEQEVQLLKAQIQATLLDIQEQMLNSAHPELRAQDEVTRAPAPEPVRAAPAEPVRLFQPESFRATEPEEPPAPVVNVGARPYKRVTITDPEKNGKRIHDPVVASLSDIEDEADDESDMGAEWDEPTPAANVRRATPTEDKQPTRTAWNGNAKAASNGRRALPEDDEPIVRSNWSSKAVSHKRRALPEDDEPIERSNWNAKAASNGNHRALPVDDEPIERSNWNAKGASNGNHRALPDDEPITQPEWNAWEEATAQATTPANAARDWIELENWVSQKVEKLGITRTRELINVYTRQEHFSRAERELLLQFVNVYDGVGKSSATVTPVSESTAMVPVRPTIVPQTRAVVEELRSELRKRRDQSSDEGGEPELTKHQDLVMRLIAGILSAGEEASIPATPSKNGHKKY